MALNIMTFSITIRKYNINITTFSIMTLSIMTLSIMTLSITTFNITIRKYDIQHSNKIIRHSA